MTGDERRQRAIDAKAKAEVATEGPWYKRTGDIGLHHGVDAEIDQQIATQIASYGDAEFIASARTLMPQLADDVLALLQENEALRKDKEEMTNIVIVDGGFFKRYQESEAENEALRQDGDDLVDPASATPWPIRVGLWQLARAKGES